MAMGKKKQSRKADGGGGARCRRHPRHRQGGAAPGVCAPCLRERLSHLSASASLPTVVRGGGRGGEEEKEEVASSCSEASTVYSSTEASTCASSSGSASPWAAAAFHFHRPEARRGAARLSLLMRHERLVDVDGDEVARWKESQRAARRSTTTRSFWGKLLHATRGGGGGKDDGCSMAHSKTLDVGRSTAAKWILF